MSAMPLPFAVKIRSSGTAARRLLPALLAVAGLAACSTQPVYERPAQPVPAHYKQALAATAGGVWQPAQAGQVAAEATAARGEAMHGRAAVDDAHAVDGDERVERVDLAEARLGLGADGDSCTVRTNPDGTTVPGTVSGLECCATADPSAISCSLPSASSGA